MVTTLLAFFFLNGAGGVVQQAQTVIGRRRRTRRYRTPLPLPAVLEESYPELRREAPREDLRALLRPFLLSGESLPVRAAPKPSAVDWEALAQDVAATSALLELWAQHIDEEDDIVLMMTL